MSKQIFYKNVGKDNYEIIPNIDQYTDQFYYIDSPFGKMKKENANWKNTSASANQSASSGSNFYTSSLNIDPKQRAAAVEDVEIRRAERDAENKKDPLFTENMAALAEAANKQFNTNRVVDVDVDDTIYENPASENPASENPASTSDPLIEASSLFEEWKQAKQPWSENFREIVKVTYAPEIKYLNSGYKTMKEDLRSFDKRKTFHVLDITKIDSDPYPNNKTGGRYKTTLGASIIDKNNGTADVGYEIQNAKPKYYINFPLDLIWLSPRFGRSKLLYNPNKTYSGGRKTKGRKTRGRKTKGRKTRKPKRRRTTRRRH